MASRHKTTNEEAQPRWQQGFPLSTEALFLLSSVLCYINDVILPLLNCFQTFDQALL